MEEYKQMYVSEKKKDKTEESLSAFMPEKETEEEPIVSVKGKVEGGSVFYKTGDVAEELNITDQDVRNYAQFFEDILKIEKTPSGHRRYTRENIDKLASILRLKQENNYTFEQIRDLLRSDEGKIVTAGDDLSRLRELMSWTLTQMSTIVKSEVSFVLSEKELMIEDKYSKENAALLEDKEKREKELDEIKSELENLKEEKLGVQKQIEEIKEETSQKDREISSLQEENEKMRKQLEEYAKKKWYQFWKQ